MVGPAWKHPTHTTVAFFIHLSSYAFLALGIFFMGPGISNVDTLLKATLFSIGAFAINFLSFYKLEAKNRLAYYGTSHAICLVCMSALALLPVLRTPCAWGPAWFIVKACGVFFAVNIMAYIPFYTMKRAREISAGSIMALSVLGVWLAVGPSFVTMDRLDELVKTGVDQRIYRYKGAYYFISNKDYGVFRLTPDRGIQRIIDGDITLSAYNGRGQKKNYKNYFCVKENMLFFEERKNWKKMDLDTSKVLPVWGGEKEAGCGFHNPSGVSALPGVVGRATRLQIGPDGYLYYSNNSGLHRTEPSGGPSQLIVAGPVTVFSVEGNKVTYYDAKKAEVTIRTLPGVPEKTVAATRKEIAVPEKGGPVDKAAQLHAEGLRKYRGHKFDEAIHARSQELTLDPRNANTVNNIAIAYNALGQHEKAVRYTKRSLELDPSFGHAYYTMGKAYVGLKAFREAKRCFEKCVALQWDTRKSRYDLCHVYLAMEDHGNAERCFRASAESWYRPAASYFLLASIYQRLDDHGKALEAYENALKFDRSLPGVHLGMGRACWALGRPWAARRAFLREIDLKSKYEPAAQVELKHMLDNIWYLRLYHRLLWFSVRLSVFFIPLFISALLIFFLRSAGQFFRPTGTKIGIMALVMFFFPFPFFLLFIGGTLPPVILHYVLDGFLNNRMSGFRILSLLCAGAIHLAVSFVCYLAVCVFHRVTARRERLRWAIMGGLMLFSLLRIYCFVAQEIYCVNSVTLYTSLFKGLMRPLSG